MKFLLFAAVVIIARPVFADSSTITVRIDDTGAVVVPVSINGRGPFQFLLDTGSSHSVISQSLADKLALPFIARTSVTTSTGREWRAVVSLNQTTIGSAQSEGLLASVAPAALLDEVARGIEGIIGQDFLFDLNYTLDYRRKRLVWRDEETHVDGVRLPLIAQEGRYLVRIASGDNDRPVLLVPDSGSSGFVAYERNGRTAAFALFAAARFGGPGSEPSLTTVHSLSGGQLARTLMLRELRLGSLTVRNQRVAIVARNQNDVAEGDGLLPLHLFATVSFNARERYLLLHGSNGLRDALDDGGGATE
jgi:predicted aspartyl protease